MAVGGSSCGLQVAIWWVVEVVMEIIFWWVVGFASCGLLGFKGS